MLQQRKVDSVLQVRPAGRWRLVKAASISVVAIALAVGGWLVWQNYQTDAANKANSKNIGHVRKGSVDVRISSTGTIRPFNQVKLSPKYTGLLTALYVQQGDLVKAGQIVALMDNSNLLGQVESARGAYEAAKAAYEKALHGSRQQEISDAEAQLRRSAAAVRAAGMAVNHTRADLVAMQAQVIRDETNARRLEELKQQGAVSDQDRLNAVTQREVTKAQLERTQQDLKQTEAALSQMKAEYESAQQHFSMIKEGSRKEDIKAAQQAMVQAAGTLRYVESQLNDTKIKAPFDGIVTQKYTDIGSIVAPTTASATNSATSSSIVSVAGRLEMVAAVSESDIDNIHPGQTVTITASAYPSKSFHGTVTLIAPEAIVTQNVTSFEVHASIDDDPQNKLMSGMNVNSDFVAGTKNGVLLIPTVCVVTKKGKTGVFVPDKNGAPHFRPVKIGSTSDTETIVASGLKEGDRIFTALSKEQLLEQGYTEKSILSAPGSGNKPDMPRGMKNKL